jgi:hypothetical protein
MLVHGGSELARFRGSVHARSDRAAATLLYLVLIVVVLLVGWLVIDPAAVAAFFDKLR